jgi:hypothetical protein
VGTRWRRTRLWPIGPQSNANVIHFSQWQGIPTLRPRVEANQAIRRIPLERSRLTLQHSIGLILEEPALGLTYRESRASPTWVPGTLQWAGNICIWLSLAACGLHFDLHSRDRRHVKLVCNLRMAPSSERLTQPYLP